jgi:hypothetical protein
MRRARRAGARGGSKSSGAGSGRPPGRWARALTADERRLLRRLDTPRRIQDFLETIPANHEPHGETCKSPREVLRTRTAHCIEGAMLAAAALWFHGRPPLLLDLKATDRDPDHVVTPFRVRGRWGAISKTNHAVLRYRDPVYRDIRELAMSYFHEYWTGKGIKTLASYSDVYDLRRFRRDGESPGGWVTSAEPQWDLQNGLDLSRHHPILDGRRRGLLRSADLIERRAGRLVQWERARNRSRDRTSSSRAAGRRRRSSA